MKNLNSAPLQRRLWHFHLLLCAAAGVALAGCAAAPAHRDAALVAPESGRAVVIGWGNSAAENARAALTPARGTRVSQLYVAKANKQKSGFDKNIVRLPPGNYELTIACGIYVDYRFFANETLMPATLRANRVYRLRAAPEGRRCEPALEDVTDAEK